MLVHVPPDARKREMLYQHDVGLPASAGPGQQPRRNSPRRTPPPRVRLDDDRRRCTRRFPFCDTQCRGRVDPATGTVPAKMRIR